LFGKCEECIRNV